MQNCPPKNKQLLNLFHVLPVVIIFSLDADGKAIEQKLKS